MHEKTTFSSREPQEFGADETDQKFKELNSKIFKIEHSIYFSNCEFFHENFYKKYGYLCHNEHVVLIEKMERRRQLVIHDLNGDSVNETTALNRFVAEYHHSPLPDVILDFSAVNYVDTNGIKMLCNLLEDFKKIDVFIYICQPQGKLWIKNDKRKRLFFLL